LNLTKKHIMNLEKKIYNLLDSGFSKEFVLSLNESKIDVLYERLKKKEQKEAVTTNVKKTVYSSAEAKGKSFAGVTTVNPDGSVIVTNEGEMNEEKLEEKFESKAQQGLFWAKCNKCKTDDCKWCKMAKEFSKSTSKKQYEKMPEKKHPEKTVKYKKKTNENVTFGDAYSKMIGSAYSNEMMGKYLESFNEEKLNQLIEKNLKPTMKKKDLLNLIENQIISKKKINEYFYFNDGAETIESSVYEPVKKYSTDIERKTKRKEKTPEFGYIVSHCNKKKGSDETIKISTNSELESYKIYKLEGIGCVVVLEESNGGELVELVNENPYTNCDDCKNDMGGEGKSQVKDRQEMSFGLSTDRSEKSGEGFQDLTPDTKRGSKFGIKPKPSDLPQARLKRRLPESFKKDFFKEFNKINEIINRKNNNI